MSNIPTLADTLALKPLPVGREKRASRVHRLMDDEPEPPAPPSTDPTEPLITPFVALDAKGDLVTAKGEAMRKAKKLALEGAMPPPVAKRHRGPGKKRRESRAPSPRGDGVSFVVDDLGQVSIVRDEARLDLSLGDTKRLALFLDRTKGFRG